MSTPVSAIIAKIMSILRLSLRAESMGLGVVVSFLGSSLVGSLEVPINQVGVIRLYRFD